MSAARPSRPQRPTVPVLRVIDGRGTPVRWSKVRTAQARIAARFYERDDVKSDVLDAVMEALARRTRE